MIYFIQQTECMSKQTSHSIIWDIKTESVDALYRSLMDIFCTGVSRRENGVFVDNDAMNVQFEFFYLQDNIQLIKVYGLAKQHIWIKRNSTSAEHYHFIFTLNEDILFHNFSNQSKKYVPLGISSAQNICYATSDVPSIIKILPGSKKYSTLFVRMPVAALDKKLFLMPVQSDTENGATIASLSGYSSMSTSMIDMIDAAFRNTLSPEIEKIFLQGTIFQLIARLLQTIKRQNEKLIQETNVLETARMVQIKNLLIKDFSEPCPHIEDMAKEACMSVSKFSYLFKKIFNMPYYQYYQHCRLMEAKELLSIGMSVKDVAFSVGFSSPANFATAFKQKFRITPSVFVNK